MSRIALVALALACARHEVPPVTAAPPVPEVVPPGDSISPDVAYLASRALRGRAAGSVGGDSASAYVARRFERLGLSAPFTPACKSAAPCRATFYQPFRVSSGMAQNVVARVPGMDAALAGEYVVVGAHSDHIGTSTAMANDVDHGAVIRPGADDNASGTAAMLELARRLAERPPRRSVLLAAFDGEELGMLGSTEFLAHPPVDPGRMTLMLNMDMVGRLRVDRLYVEVDGPRALSALVDSSVRLAGLRPSSTKETRGRSDHATFVDRHIPAVALFTGFHDDYHRATDVPARVNYAGIRRVVDVAERIVRAAADSGLAADPPRRKH